MTPCKNCESPLSESYDYCPECGAKVIRNRLTIGNLFSHFIENFLNYDNKFFKTFWHLITKPEAVIDGYIEGIRKRYINPMSYFAIAITLTGLQMFIINKYFPEYMDISVISVKGSEEFTRNWMQVVSDYQSLVFMLNIPIYALLGTLVFWTLKRYNYTEFLVVFLYAVPQYTFLLFIPLFILMVLGYNTGELSLGLILVQFLYFGYLLKRVLRLTTKGLILRVLLLFAVLAVIYVLVIVIFLLIIILTGNLENFMEAQKSVQ
ncbi:MAG: DUF3667 domain-containing protein [Bacteroidia bacterium]|nr:DUF3667 domain-containing protein [Bacteroidia bacterium]MBT8268953.1 DUF3667 domain-containing protein [Bacteroidia bacterium]NNF83232.1 DUF3667 domain-containing protein [Flavobacteriaceae bacterium]NNK70074.1 DUF3667 domain-containing protein [Flavobacteriaceae bacterium]NNL81371.1 DUF3667 domain-containing protein [Flavobacteriaceae bacterium]